MDAADSELIKRRRHGDIAPRPGHFSTALEKARLAPDEPRGYGHRHQLRPPRLRRPIGHEEDDACIGVECVLKEPRYEANRREGI